jgi:hypothetical protein
MITYSSELSSPIYSEMDIDVLIAHLVLLPKKRITREDRKAPVDLNALNLGAHFQATMDWVVMVHQMVSQPLGQKAEYPWTWYNGIILHVMYASFKSGAVRETKESEY